MPEEKIVHAMMAVACGMFVVVIGAAAWAVHDQLSPSGSARNYDRTLVFDHQGDPSHSSTGPHSLPLMLTLKTIQQKGSGSKEMDNTELLELAARAAGKEISHWTKHCPRVLAKGSFVVPWNPLTCSEDALELAVTLQLPIQHSHDQVEVRAGYTTDGQTIVVVEHVPSEDTRLAALRTAITKAAAMGQKARESE